MFIYFLFRTHVAEDVIQQLQNGLRLRRRHQLVEAGQLHEKHRRVLGEKKKEEDDMGDSSGLSGLYFCSRIGGGMEVGILIARVGDEP